jgi:hypothetical protein
MPYIKNYMEDSKSIKAEVASLHKAIAKNERSICKLINTFIKELLLYTKNEELLDISVDVREHIIVFILHYEGGYNTFLHFTLSTKTNLFKVVNNANSSKVNLEFIELILEKLNTKWFYKPNHIY